MSRSRYGSPRLRYLKARLSILARPSFLVAVVFLSAVGLVIKEYWTNPDFLKFSQNQESSPSSSSSNQSLLSDEDRAIAADIDNLSVLDYDKQQANIPPTASIKNSNKVKKQNEAQLTKILELAKKSQKENEIKPNTAKSQTTEIPSASQQNPFLQQAENLLQLNLDTDTKDTSVNNLSPFSANSQTPQSSFNFGINNNNSANLSQNTNSGSALQTAINQSTKNSQILEKSAANTSTDKNTFGQIPQAANQGLPQSQTNPLVNTTIFNQPLNSQRQNPYNNFNNNQLPVTTYNQPGLNNQAQNPYGNFNNFNNNQVPTTNYNQPSLNNQVQNSYSNFNNTQLPSTNYVQPNLSNNFNNNQQQNPYSNFNRNQLPANNYNQQNLNNRVQNPYSNFNNNQITGSRYSPQVQTRINNIYNRLTSRENPTIVNPNTYTPNNNINTGLQQPNVQQLNSPYSPQNTPQYPNNGYRY